MRVRRLLWALPTLCVLAASHASVAAATGPGWYECARAPQVGGVYTGDYTDRSCSQYVSAGGKYELRQGVAKGKPFEGKGTAATLNVVVPSKGDVKVECASFSDRGQPTLPNRVVHVSVTFSKCEALGAPCESGATPEAIETSPLSGELGWIDKATDTVGVQLYDEAAPGTGLIAQFECKELGQFTIHGGVIGQQSHDVNLLNREFALTFAVGPYLGELEPGYTPLVNTLEFEGGTQSVLETTPNVVGFPPGERPSGLEASAANKGEDLLVGTGGAGGGTGGVVAGTVRNAFGPVEGALVSICGSDGCYSEYTEEGGVFELRPIPEGAYVASISPPPGSPDAELTSSSFNVTAGSETTEDFALVSPEAPPNGTEIEGNGVVDLGEHEYPEVYWQEESPIRTHACVGGTVTVTVTATNKTTGVVETTTPMSLAEDPANSGTFTGRLPAPYPLHGEATVTIAVTGCPNTSEDETVGFAIYIDPSGTVVDANNGDAPVAGAKVTLLAASSLDGTYSAVPNGSAVMSLANRINPFTTASNGSFGWDTVPGFYEVTATKTGCGSATTAPFQVPPPKVDLELVLHCVAELVITTHTLPGATRGEGYEEQLRSAGGSAPYKWKKTAPLPKGLKLSSSGLLHGTPSTKLTARSYPISVELTSGTGKNNETTIATLTLAVS